MILITELSDVVSRVNSKGPRTEPWGTPHEVGNAAEKQFAILKVWCPPVRYDKNQFRAVLISV